MPDLQHLPGSSNLSCTKDESALRNNSTSCCSPYPTCYLATLRNRFTTVHQTPKRQPVTAFVLTEEIVQSTSVTGQKQPGWVKTQVDVCEAGSRDQTDHPHTSQQTSVPFSRRTVRQAPRVAPVKRPPRHSLFIHQRLHRLIPAKPFQVSLSLPILPDLVLYTTRFQCGAGLWRRALPPKRMAPRACNGHTSWPGTQLCFPSALGCLQPAPEGGNSGPVGRCSPLKFPHVCLKLFGMGPNNEIGSRLHGSRQPQCSLSDNRPSCPT